MLRWQALCWPLSATGLPAMRCCARHRCRRQALTSRRCPGHAWPQLLPAPPSPASPCQEGPALPLPHPALLGGCWRLRRPCGLQPLCALWSRRGLVLGGGPRLRSRPSLAQPAFAWTPAHQGQCIRAADEPHLQAAQHDCGCSGEVHCTGCSGTAAWVPGKPEGAQAMANRLVHSLTPQSGEPLHACVQLQSCPRAACRLCCAYAEARAWKSACAHDQVAVGQRLPGSLQAALARWASGAARRAWARAQRLPQAAQAETASCRRVQPKSGGGAGSCVAGLWARL